MATARGITDPLVDVFTAVPSAGDGICETCHVACPPQYQNCYSCNTTRAGVTHALDVVVPVSLHIPNSQMGKWLRRYKDPDSYSPETQRRFTVYLAALLTRFLANHASCIECATGEQWDILAIVPSTRNGGEHPLAELLRMTPHRDHVRPVLERLPGDIGHNKPNEAAFESQVDAGTRVLLIDDTFTSGSRIQSAASSLTTAGATVVAGVVLGRAINTKWSWTDQEWWADQRRLLYDFNVCWLE